MTNVWAKTRRVWELARDEFHVPLTTFHVEPFDQFAELLRSWNPLSKLMSVHDVENNLDEHFADSLALLPYLGPCKPQTVYADLGSGGGIPGIPLAIARPELEVWLVDRSKRKTAFQKRVAVALGLNRVRPINKTLPSDDLVNSTIYAFTARAIERPEALADWYRRMVDHGHMFLCQTRTINFDAERFQVTRIQDLFDSADLRRGPLHVIRRRS